MVRSNHRSTYVRRLRLHLWLRVSRAVTAGSGGKRRRGGGIAVHCKPSMDGAEIPRNVPQAPRNARFPSRSVRRPWGTLRELAGTFRRGRGTFRDHGGTFRETGWMPRGAAERSARAAERSAAPAERSAAPQTWTRASRIAPERRRITCPPASRSPARQRGEVKRGVCARRDLHAPRRGTGVKPGTSVPGGEAPVIFRVPKGRRGGSVQRPLLCR